MPVMPCCKNPSCLACDGLSSDKITVTFYGTNLCQCFWIPGLNKYVAVTALRSPSNTIDGTYCLESAPEYGQCVWRFTLPFKIRVAKFAFDCTGTPSSVVDEDCIIIFEISEISTSVVTVYVSASLTTSNMYLFNKSFTYSSKPICYEIMKTFLNEIENCNSVFLEYQPAGYGGAVDASWGC
jgi:hypothetical protein